MEGEDSHINNIVGRWEESKEARKGENLGMMNERNLRKEARAEGWKDSGIIR
jgi:hypothetical protein